MSAEAATVDQLTVLLLLREHQSLNAMSDYGLTIDQFDDKTQRAIKFITQYTQDNEGLVPGPEIVASEVDWPIVYDDEIPTNMTLRYVSSIILERSALRIMREGSKQIEQALRLGTSGIERSKQLFQEYSDKVSTVGAVKRQTTSIFDLYPDIQTNYYLRQQGMLNGLMTPWPSVTAATSGYKPGQVIFFTGRPGQGKTWNLILNCLQLYKQGQRILFISPELSQMEVAERAACIQMELSFDAYQRGLLSESDLSRLNIGVEYYKTFTGFHVLEDEMSFKKEDVVRAIEKHSPDVVAFDSVYHFGTGSKRQERIEAACPWIKQIAKRGAGKNSKKLIVFATAQMNRNAIDLDSQTMDNIYGSDAVGQDADLIYSIFQNDEMRANKQIALCQLKVRNGKYHPPIYAMQDLDKMKFGELTDFDSAPQQKAQSWGEMPY
jgi:replicative DNA helicase